MRIPILFLLFSPIFLFAQKQDIKAPAFAIGFFVDDYGINYTISDTLWTQGKSTKYHVLKWDLEKQYAIVKNDVQNKSDANKYTRIDYMIFDDMKPWVWGFCLTTYDADTFEIAENKAKADRENPKKGCNGYPFSRMKVLD